MSRSWPLPERLGEISSSDELSSLATATAWINSPPLTAATLQGKVVLVQFWTFTCINWLRTMPYSRAWTSAYKNSGLTTIGVHTPEFIFEHDVDNVRRAVSEMHIGYPVAIDNTYGIWGGFSNQYWPALYLLDGSGRIRYRQFGEGDYDKTERAIQQVLEDSGAHVADTRAAIDARGIEAPADWFNLKSAENYVGYARSSTDAGRSRAVRSPRTARTTEFRIVFTAGICMSSWDHRKAHVLCASVCCSTANRRPVRTASTWTSRGMASPPSNGCIN